MKICIPSHKRATTITTHQLAPDALACVPESQAGEYERAGCRDVATHPDDIRGLTPKLNWMLDHLADEEGIIFLDDDLEYLYRCFTSREEQSSRKVTEARVINQILRQTAALAAEAGKRVVDNALIVFYEGKRAGYEIPDFALDRHTQRGRRLKRGWGHFFTEGVGPLVQPDAVYEARAREIRRDNRLELEG